MVAAATELADQPGTYFTDQLRNSDSRAGYRDIGHELVEQIHGPIDVFCAAVGTAGLAMGVSGGRPGQHHVEGIGIGSVPPLLDPDRYDDVRPVAEADGRAMALDWPRKRAC